MKLRNCGTLANRRDSGMLGFHLLVCGIGFWLAALGAHADLADPNEGYIGSTLVAGKGSDFPVVDYVATKSPAANAGIRKGDVVTAINGVSTQGMPIGDVWKSTQGAIGGTVTLTVRRGTSAEVQVPVIRRSALDTYLPAANAGDPEAERNVGFFYEGGPTATRDLAMAADWYQKAANQGNAWAQADLGHLYRHGLGVSKDFDAAYKWLSKGAAQGNPLAERELAMCYYRGEGVSPSDEKAFAWFYSSAQQDDAVAEEYLGSLYRNGRGVARDDQQSFNWYYCSAQQNDGFGAWGLAYMYENGRGVKQNLAESMKWYLQAQTLLPKNDGLRRDVALICLKSLMENPASASLDTSVIMTAFGPEIVGLFLLLTLVYFVGGIVLLYVSFKATERPAGLRVAIGWLLFFLESQMVALLAILIFGKTLDAQTLFIVTSLFSALPVIASTCGQNRKRIWKASAASWKRVLLYGVGSFLAIFVLSFGYDTIYALFVHAPLPKQSTVVLITKSKQASAWLSYAMIGLILPATEEILFRSYLFEALQRRFSGKIVVVVTALAFSLAHFQWLYLVPLFSFGLVLGWLKLKTGSLRATVFLHAMNNSLFLALAI